MCGVESRAICRRKQQTAASVSGRAGEERRWWMCLQAGSAYRKVWNVRFHCVNQAEESQ